MKTLKEIAENYINLQIRKYRRNLTSYQKSFIRDFAEYIGQELNYSVTPLIGQIEADNQIKGNRIAIITEEIGSMTGGRYYAWFIACALVEAGYSVTLYTSQQPTYLDFFKEYEKPKVVVIEPKSRLKHLDIQADLYIGVPLLGNFAVCRLSKKYNKPCYVMVFDPIPMQIKYMKKAYTGWETLVHEIRNANVSVIALCNSTVPYIADWLGKREDQIVSIYPCINNRELEKTGESARGNYIVFVSRLVGHKGFESILEVLGTMPNDLRLKAISSTPIVDYQKMAKRMNLEDRVDFLFFPTDQEKFQIIREAKAVISASIFEGFGMYAAEALACGTPYVGYEYPTVEEIRDVGKADNFYLAKLGQVDSLKEQLEKALEEGKFRERNTYFDFPSMVDRVKSVFSREVKVGVITIALNEQKFIEASLRSVIKHPAIKKVAVIEGAVNLFKHGATKEGFSIDRTQQKVLEVMNDTDKIIYERYGWATDKSELRNRGLSFLKDMDYILVVDADEVWTYEDLDRLVEAMKTGPDIIRFRFNHFFKYISQVAIGGQWESKMFRCFKFYNKSLHWEDHEKSVVNGQGVSLEEGITKTAEDISVYHLGYVKDQKDILDKLRYYIKRDTDLIVRDTWSNWKQGDPTSPTHGGGTAIKFEGTYPEEIKEMIEKGVFD